MKTIRRRSLLAGAVAPAIVALGWLAGAPAAMAQAYPNRPITLVVPFPPGGATDPIARIFSTKISEAWGVPVVIENKAGAGTTIGTNSVAKAKPDGYTMLFTATSLVTNPALYAKLPYDTLKDLTYVSQACTLPFVLTVNPSLNVKDTAELVALAKREPGKLNYASSGPGTMIHLAGEYFKSRTKIDVTHVPYKGSSASTTAVMTGEASFTIDTLFLQMPLIKAGKLKVIGTTSAARLDAMPDLPAVAETFPEFSVGGWMGFMGPANLPPQITAKWAEEVARIAKMPDVQERLRATGVVPVGGTPAQFTRIASDDVAKWQKVVEEARIPKVE
jgi:tripartite-type tricarboxylate transporter receptor subunit TctC